MICGMAYMAYAMRPCNFRKTYIGNYFSKHHENYIKCRKNYVLCRKNYV